MKNENIIEHQFLNSDFYLPSWKVKTLVLGTFNPNCGQTTDYFYGRNQNNFWRTIENIKGLDYGWFQDNYMRKLKCMSENEFGCADIIKSILKSDVVDKKEICGSGYSDQILFTAKKCKVTYNFDEIKSFILNTDVKNVIHTWGKRDSPSEFKKHIKDFKTFCDQNSIFYIDDCPSPSGRLRSNNHKNNLFRFYKLHLIKSAHNKT
jgi:G:T/U-mismatch repair DNA glycosylase